MRILAVVPARGGSKRLPRKNIKSFGGKPLIVWSIDVARNVPSICEILVSTDNAEIAAVSREAGAFVPWLRPETLATDTASSVDVVLHAVDYFEEANGEVDGVLLLQPTSPFRTTETILRGIELFVANGHKPVIGVSPTQSHPLWALRLEGDFAVPFISDQGFGRRSQDLTPAYMVNGSFYLITPEELRSQKSFFSTAMIPLIIESQKEAVDIDTDYDLRVAEALLNFEN